MPAKKVPFTDEEIFDRISARSTGELISFGDKLRDVDTPQAWGLRFVIIKVLLSRAISA